MGSNIDNSPFKNSTWLSAWTKKFCSATVLYQSGIHKRSSHSAYWLLQLFLALRFSNSDVYRFQGEGNPLPERSAFYEFLAQKRYNWERLVFTVARQIIVFFTSLTTARGDRVLILDDSSYKRDRSKKVELLGRHHDHNDNTYYKGFRMLTLAWSDGHSLVPLGFELLSNATKEKRIGAIPDYDGYIAPTVLPYVMLARNPWPPLRSDHRLRICRTEGALVIVAGETWYFSFQKPHSVT